MIFCSSRGYEHIEKKIAIGFETIFSQKLQVNFTNNYKKKQEFYLQLQFFVYFAPSIRKCERENTTHSKWKVI